MIETVVYVGMSLDGYIAGEGGTLDWLPQPPEGEDFGWAEFLAGIDTLVMGRATFETVRQFDAWPYDGTPVVVLSRTMNAVPPELEGKVRVSSKEPAALLVELGSQGVQRVYIDGGRVIQSFLAADRVDEMILTTVPVLLGGGVPLFGKLDARQAWSLEGAQQLGMGLTKTTYRRAR